MVSGQLKPCPLHLREKTSVPLENEEGGGFLEKRKFCYSCRVSNSGCSNP